MASKYGALTEHLRRQSGPSCSMSFDEIASLVGTKLPASSRAHRAWWGDDRVNSSFHGAIARASGNLVLAQIVESLIELYSSELHSVDPTRSLEEVRAGDHGHHVQIAAAIRQRDGDGARRAMERHLGYARSRVERRLAQPQDGATELGAAQDDAAATGR